MRSVAKLTILDCNDSVQPEASIVFQFRSNHAHFRIRKPRRNDSRVPMETALTLVRKRIDANSNDSVQANVIKCSVQPVANVSDVGV